MTPGQAIDRWPGLKLRPAQVTAIIAAADGRVVDQDAMMERLFDLTADRPSYEGMRRAVQNARRSGVPIVTVYGLGWRMGP